MSADDPRPDFPLPGPDLALHRLIDAISDVLGTVEDDNKLFTAYGYERSSGLREFDRAADRLEKALQAPLGDCNPNYRSVIKASVECLRDNRSSGTGWDLRALAGLKKGRAALESLLARRQGELPAGDRSIHDLKVSPTPDPHNPSAPRLTPAIIEILETLAESKKRLTRDKLIESMKKTGRERGQSTVANAMPKLGKAGWVDNKRNVDPPGYRITKEGRSALSNCL
jgi:hypothetical protein